MKIQLTITEAAELEMLTLTAQEAPFILKHGYKSDIVGSQRKLRGALERIGLRRNENGWKGPKRVFAKTIEVDFSRVEVLVLIILLMFAIGLGINADYNSLPCTLEKMNARAREVGPLIER